MTSSMSSSSPDGQHAELELGVGEDDPRPLARPRRRAGTARATMSRTRSASSPPTSVVDALERDVLVVLALGAFVAGVKIGSGSRSLSRRPAGSGHAAHGAASLVLLPAAARQVAAHDALDGSTSARRPSIIRPRSVVDDLRVAIGDLVRDVGGIRRDAGGSATIDAVSREPEARQAGEHPALVRDRRRQHDVERRQPVRRDEQQPVVAHAVQVAHLARAHERVSAASAAYRASASTTRGLQARRAGR